MAKMADILVSLEIDEERLEDVRKAQDRVAAAAKELREASMDLQEKLLDLNKGLRLNRTPNLTE